MQQLHVFCGLSKDGEALTSKVYQDEGRYVVKLWADDRMVLSRSYPFHDFPTDQFPVFAAWEMVNPTSTIQGVTMNEQQRTLDILAQLRELITPEIDALMCELESLTEYGDESIWDPEDGRGQALKEGARNCYGFVATSMHQVMGARTIINEVLALSEKEQYE